MGRDGILARFISHFYLFIYSSFLSSLYETNVNVQLFSFSFFLLLLLLLIFLLVIDAGTAVVIFEDVTVDDDVPVVMEN